MWVLLSIHPYVPSLTHCNAPGNRALWQMGIQHRDISASNMMYKRIDGKVRGYLIDFDLASLEGRDSQNLDRTGTMPFMALELLRSVGPGRPTVPHAYEHDGEAVCWVVFWLGVQYKDGTRERYSFAGWEMVDAATCYEKKLATLADLHMHPFTLPNKPLQEPIRDLLGEFDLYIFQKRRTRGDVPVPDVGGWIDECDKKIRAHVMCFAE